MDEFLLRLGEGATGVAKDEHDGRGAGKECQVRAGQAGGDGVGDVANAGMGA